MRYSKSCNLKLLLNDFIPGGVVVVGIPHPAGQVTWAMKLQTQRCKSKAVPGGQC